MKTIVEKYLNQMTDLECEVHVIMVRSKDRTSKQSTKPMKFDKLKELIEVNIYLVPPTA